jgi:hypothetical protein
MFKMRSKFLYFVFLIASIVLVSITGYWYFNSVHFAILFSSLAFGWCLLTLISVLLLLFDIQLPKRYYKTDRWKNQITLYKKMGILTFRDLIRRGQLHKLAPHIQITNRNQSFNVLSKNMQQAETIHVIAFLITFITCIISLIVERVFNGLILMLFNLIFHVYPVMLQRFNRIRIENLVVKRIDNELEDKMKNGLQSSRLPRQR